MENEDLLHQAKKVSFGIDRETLLQFAREARDRAPGENFPAMVICSVGEPGCDLVVVRLDDLPELVDQVNEQREELE